ncbi:MAG UNVERIFIED_CONTAM: tRNA(Met) cytidine acetyltransferase, partial [Klebsiella aerogenes]
METLLDLTARMAREGIRRLLVLSGDEHWCLAQAVELRERLGGDSLWVGALPQQE